MQVFRFIVCLIVILTLLTESSVPYSRADQDPYGEFVAKSAPKSPAEEKKCFHLPPGFDIELVTCEPAIIKPINLNFDDRGRILVTQSIEYPFPAPATRKPRDTIKVIELTRDGVADKVTTFADGLNIPIGVLPIPHGAIVYSIPNIYRLLDTDGAGRADKRELLYTRFGFADTHGMASSFTWGFDGWIYACHGFSNTSTVKGGDGAAVTMQSGNTYRMKPDGSHIEQFTHGQVNPFGLCFDPLGNLYSADCHTRPIMMLLRNGYYQSFGKPDDGLGFAPEMCDHDHGSTAIAGIVYYAAEQFPPSYRDTIFIGNVVTNRINHDRLERHGSTFKAIEQPDFLSCDDSWFRPVDIKLGPDGALYVADFYNRIIGHYEVPLTHPGRDHERGRIWRIVYRGHDATKSAIASKNFSDETTGQLLADLANRNLVIRMKAANQLVERGGQTVPDAVRAVFAKTESDPFQRMHGLWILERLGRLDDSILRASAKDPNSGARVHAMRILAERPALSESEHAAVVMALRDPDAFVQRAAADALGRHPSAANMAPLLALEHSVPADDTHLLHVVRMAMRDQLRPSATWRQLPEDSWTERDVRAVADVAAGVPSPESAAFLLAHIRRTKEPENHLSRYVHHIARYGDAQSLRSLIAFARGHESANLPHQVELLKAIQQGTQERGDKVTGTLRQWAEQLVGMLLRDAKSANVVAGAELAGSIQIPQLEQTLVAIAAKNNRDEKEREAAVDALMAMNPSKHMTLRENLLNEPSGTITFREHIAKSLASTNRPEAHTALLKALIVAPASLQNTIAGGLATSPQGAAKLLDAVAAGKASARLLQVWLVHIRLTKYAELRGRLAKLTEGLPPADENLQALLKTRRSGFAAAKPDPALGARVFEKSCAICHQLGGNGAKIGPQLDGIGIRGVDRLLEDIIDPNRNVDQAFRSTTLVLKNGQIVSGLVLREEGEVLVLADTQGKEVRVAKSSVAERTVSQLSPMPANLVDQIPEADFYHLLAYLISQRPGVNGKPSP
jgi:putative heme-binding domain-containing protein